MKYSVQLLAGLSLVTVLAACDDKTATDVQPRASVRFVNATADATALNFAVNGTAAAQAQNLAFGAATQCATVNTGARSFTSSVVGGGALGTGANQTLASGSRYTVIATGTVASPQYLVLNDAATTPTAGNAMLRIVNALPGTTASDIYVTAPDAELGTATATNIGFNAGTQFVSVPAGQTQIRFADTGTTTVSYTGTPFSLTAGQVRTVVIAPGATEGTFRTIDITPCT